MVEMVVALSLIMMAVSLLLPQTLLIMQERKNINMSYKALILLKKEAVLFKDEEKREKEQVIKGIVYYTYWRGDEVCAVWKDMRGKAMEQCLYAEKR
ncbi:competence protein ComG [Bacillus cereus]|uniref:Competence protein ComG n=1 Tax=Bacillus cereus TaxID=1396 RepID=A0A2B0U0R3_BACCE|nr:competence protein ComG [Bacillus cereus]PFL22883.1 competence protein ComG [Bacillus cereus]PFU40144.1 competence protein ComG [Bacillus cereus]